MTLCKSCVPQKLRFLDIVQISVNSRYDLSQRNTALCSSMWCYSQVLLQNMVLASQSGVWQSDEGICGEWSSDGHAVSVDHRGTADGDMLIKSCQSSNVAADLERIYQLFQ